MLTCQTAKADLHPSLSIIDMCFKADAIVEGHYLGEDKVLVGIIYKTHPMLKDTLEVRNLDMHFKLPNVNKLLLFLSFNNPDDYWNTVTLHYNNHIKSPKPENGWNPLDPYYYSSLFENRDAQTSSIDSLIGSSGVIWIHDTVCYRYYQLMNPGGYGLLEMNQEEVFGALEGGKYDRLKGIRDEIRMHIQEMHLWNNIAALPEPERSRQFSLFLLKKTSPLPANGWYYSYKVFSNHIQGKVKIEFPFLFEQLQRADTSEDLKNLLTMFRYVQVDKDKLMPVLGEMLTVKSKFKKDYTSTIIWLYSYLQDKKSFPYLRQIFEYNSYYKRKAALVLCELQDRRYYEPIKSYLVHPLVNFDNADREDLSALYKLNPHKATRIIKQLAKQYDYFFDAKPSSGCQGIYENGILIDCKPIKSQNLTEMLEELKKERRLGKDYYKEWD